MKRIDTITALIGIEHDMVMLQTNNGWSDRQTLEYCMMRLQGLRHRLDLERKYNGDGI